MNIIRQVPNLLTLANLCVGVCGIINIFNGDYRNTIYYILVAGIFDFFDGFAARILKVKGDFGKELDSLADMVTFGIVPALFIFYYSSTYNYPDWVSYSSMLIVIFSAIRLAKFNIDTRQSSTFIGVPVPANAIMLTTIVQISIVNTVPFIPLVLSMVSSILMVAPVKMLALKFVNYHFKGNELRYMLITGILLGLSIFKIIFLPYIIPYYIMLSLVSSFTFRSSH